MNMLLLLAVTASAVILFSILNSIGKSKRPFKKSICTVISGAAALAAVNLLSPFTGVAVPISVMSLLVSVVGGIPGVTLILALNAFF